MKKVISNITMSLDGFIAGPDISGKQPMGKDGIRLHNWIFNSKTDIDSNLLNEVIESSGAVIVGSRTYLTAIEDAWEGVSPFTIPAFVICHNLPAKAVNGFAYVTDGIESTLNKAKVASGDKNIWVMGGANIIQQYLNAKLLDSLHIHIAPVLFANGTRLFDKIGIDQIELKKIKVIDAPGATHIEYEIEK
jgi:dihydrofolate reductase